jgi:hypothetical protein
MVLFKERGIGTTFTQQGKKMFSYYQEPTITIVYIPFAAVNIIGLPDVINIVCSC